MNSEKYEQALHVTFIAKQKWREKIDVIMDGFEWTRKVPITQRTSNIIDMLFSLSDEFVFLYRSS